MAEEKQETRAQEQLVDLGSATTRSSRGNIYTLTIIGQIEGHQALPENIKTTKYEHVIPLLAAVEESEDIDGLLLLLNTVGGDIEAGLAIARPCRRPLRSRRSPSYSAENLHGKYASFLSRNSRSGPGSG